MLLEKRFGDFVGVLKIDKTVNQNVINIFLFIFFIFFVKESLVRSLPINGGSYLTTNFKGVITIKLIILYNLNLYL
jgi:hypothetical protein